MTKAYKLSILYYLAFSILLILSAYMLFEHKIGFSYQGVVEYYTGNEDKFIIAKSFSGILKIVLPHIFVFGLLSMVLLHFLVFTKLRYKKSTLVLIYLTFFTAFTEIFSPFLIISGLEFFAYLKLLSFFVFSALILYISWLLLKSIIRDI
ncbi:hypothetical protein [Sulfurimonas sp.]|uniref:hypothetical protein n=1 Tax=Sulfurimonas sp. TaxID=2022749 RepID=UPI002B47FC0A|nr:hypothetical protein [Sulfurimonas sp.]